MFFGAEASRGSGYVNPYAPPLGGQLFNELRNYSPSICGNLPRKIHKNFEQNFENAMKTVFNNSYLVPSLMREMAKYFCIFRPINNSNLYARLLHDLRRSLKEIVFSTLNYDLMFEHALQSQGLVAECFLEDTTDITYRKLHGSCNFVLEAGTWINCNFRGPNAVESNLKALNADEVINYCNSNDSLSPAMCVYMESKPSQFVW